MVAKYSISEQQRKIIKQRIPGGSIINEDIRFDGHWMFIEMDTAYKEWNDFAKDVVLFLQGKKPEWWEWAAKGLCFDSGEKSPQDHTNIATKALNLVCGDRNDSYGPPAEDFKRLAKVWSGLLGNKLKEDLTAKETTLMMAALKLNREVFAHKQDNLVDAVGYSILAEWIETGVRPKT